MKVLFLCVLASETGAVDRWSGGTARRWEADDRSHCLNIMSARREKHDCRYPDTVPLQIRWTAVDVVEPWCGYVVIDRQGTSGTIAGPGYDLTRQEAQLSQRDWAAAWLNFGKNISANSVHLTLLCVTALTSTNHHFTVLWHHVCT